MSFLSYENDDSHRQNEMRMLFQFRSQQSNNPVSVNGSKEPPPANTYGKNVDQSGDKEYSFHHHHDVINHFQNKSHKDNNDVIIPIPDWPAALKEWGACWDIHVYGLAALFLSLSFLSCAIFFRFRARVLRFQIVLNTLVLLATSGLFRAIFLLIDAYGHQERMAGFLVGIMTQAVYPLLCACYGLTQVMLVKVTNVDVGPTKFRSLSSLLGCTLGYLFLVVVIESIVYYAPHLKLLLLLDSGCFIAWALYLTITFICSGFKLSQYTNETKKARKELNAFSNQRRSASNTNALSTISYSSNDTRLSPGPADSLNVTPTLETTATDFSGETTSASFPSSSSCSFSNYAPNKPSTMRLSRPKMKISDHNHMTIAMVTDDDDQSTSSTDVEHSQFDASQIRSSHKAFTRRQKKRSSKSRIKSEYKSKREAAIEGLISSSKHNEHSNKCKSVIDKNSKYSSIPTDEKRISNGLVNQPTSKKMQKNYVLPHADKQDTDLLQDYCHHRDISNTCMDTVVTCETNLGPDVFRDESGLLEEVMHSPQGCELSKSKPFDSIEPDIDLADDSENISSSLKENGYLADTENVLTRGTLSKTRPSRLRTSGNCSQYDTDEENSSDRADVSDLEGSDISSPPVMCGRLRSDTPAIISLFRIRQSKMVQRAVHLTYVLTFLFTFACLMQLYTVFGVYGVLGKIRRPKPWPWFVFHTIFRLLECSIGFTCAAIAFITLNHRHQRAKRRLQQQQQQQQQQQPHHHQPRQAHQQQQHLQQQNSPQESDQRSSFMNTRECVV